MRCCWTLLRHAVCTAVCSFALLLDTINTCGVHCRLLICVWAAIVVLPTPQPREVTPVLAPPAAMTERILQKY